MKDRDKLIEIMETMAKLFFDGHYTIFKFTTHYKVMLGSPNLDVDGRKYVSEKLIPGNTLEEALLNGIKHGLEIINEYSDQEIIDFDGLDELSSAL